MSMARVCLFLLIALLACQLASKAVTGHSISNLRSNPISLTEGSVVNLNLLFKLTAESGIDANRILFLYNNGSFANDNGVFTVTNKSDHPNTQAGIKFEIESFKPQAKNNFDVFYCLTSYNCDTKLALERLVINTTPNGSAPQTDNGNGAAFVAPIIFRMNVEEISNGDLGSVSLSAKQFRITVEHNSDFLDQVDDDNFNAVTNPILSSLRIRSTNVSTKKNTNVTDTYSFNLENGSVESENAGLLITKYISNPMVIKTGQRLRFLADLTKLYFEKFTIPLPENSIATRKKSILITPLEGDISDISIADTISFSNIGKSQGKTNYLSDTVIINVKTTGSEIPMGFNSVNFFRFNKNNEKIKSKLSINKNTKLNIKPSLALGENGSISGTTISLPVNLTTSAKETYIVNKGFNDQSKNKTLNIPLIISTNNANGLELIYNSSLNSSVSTSFPITTVEVNGSSL